MSCGTFRDMSKALDLSHFLATDELAGLGPGPRASVQPQPLLEEQVQTLLKPSGLSHEHQELILALVLLWHDHLDAAHVIAQNVEGPDGAFVHGIMHRREPDFGNAAYWFRRVGRHGAFGTIATQAGALLSGSRPELATKLVPDGNWDPFAFIEACSRAKGAEPEQRLLRQIQRIEFAA